MSTVDVGASIRAGKRPLRAAVFQIDGVHDEITPSLFQVLLANGVEPTGFMSHRLEQRGDIFSAYTPFGDRISFRDFTPGTGEVERLQEELQDFDLLVLNTMGWPIPSQVAKRSGLPTIGIVHNPRMVLADQTSVDLVRSGQATCATLAPHVTSWMMTQSPDLFSKTVTLGAWMWEMPELGRAGSTRRRIAVPGAVDFDKRDFPGLLDILPGLVAEYGADTFVISVGAGGTHRRTLESMIRERGLSDVFELAPFDAETGMALSSDYYPRVAGADLLLPMLPERQSAYRVYKISAALSTTIGFGVPAILDRWTASVYDLPAVTYQLGRLEDGLHHALALPQAEIDAMRAGLEAHRAAMIERSIGEMGLALADLGNPPVPIAPGTTEDDDAPPDGATTSVLATAVRLDVKRDDKESFLTFVDAVLPASYSQRLQDLWALWESGFRLDGWFVEFGALGGRDYSNTYLMERLGWNGVVADPHPAYIDAMVAHRTCTISTKCVLDTTGDVVDFHVVTDRPALSTVAGFGQDDDRSVARESYEVHRVETITLEDLLAESGAPDVVDYLSIDTEGSEAIILGAYDFTRRPIRMISVEHNEVHRDELFTLLTEQGYVRRWPELSGHDDWYVLEGAYPDWSVAAMPEFVATADTVKPFVRDLPARRGLVRNLRTRVAPSRELLGLPEGPPVPTGTSKPKDDRAVLATYQFEKRFHRALADRAGLTVPQANDRVARMFVRLAAQLHASVVLEVGAGDASFSRRAKRLLPDARVIAFEADPAVYDEHSVQARADGVDYRRQAVAAMSGRTHLQFPHGPDALDPVEPGSASLKRRRDASRHGLVEVESVRLDEAMADEPEGLVVLRLDVSGAYDEVFAGARRTLRRARAVCVEVTEEPRWEDEWTDSEVAAFLMQKGFVLVARDQAGPDRLNLVFVHRSVADRPAVARLAARVHAPGPVRARRAPADGAVPEDPKGTATRLLRAVGRRLRR